MWASGPAGVNRGRLTLPSPACHHPAHTRRWATVHDPREEYDATNPDGGGGVGNAGGGAGEAGIVLTATETTDGVVIQGGGTLDLNGATAGGTSSSPAGINPSYSFVLTGSTSGSPLDQCRTVTNGGSFGPGDRVFASSASGDAFGLGFNGGVLVVPTGYVSDSSLSGTATFASATFDSLGLNVGTYLFTLPNDTFTFQVGPAAVATPEPATLASAASGLVALGLYGYRRSRRKAS